MTSCSGKAVVLATAMVIACRRTETPIEVRVLTPCSIPTATVNTFVVTLLSTSRDQLNQPCTECSQGRCTFIQEACTCSDEDVPAATSILGAQLRGLRLEDVDTDRYYCVRVVALDVAGNVGGTCACDDWRASPADARICAFSTVGIINNVDIPLTVSLASCMPGAGTFNACLAAGE